MQVHFEKAETKDARILAKICERAFHNDVDYGAPGPAGGPPGYNSDLFQIRLMISSEYYNRTYASTILIEGERNC